MNPQAQAVSGEPIASPAKSAVSQAPSRLYRALLFPIKFFWGMLFCQGLVGGIFVVGWSYRLAQRGALKLWFSRSARPHTASGFQEFLSASDWTRAHRHWPNWFAQQNFRETVGSLSEFGPMDRLVLMVRALVHSLWLNFWVGLRGIANTWALTLPACVLWWFGWYDGWNNSFNKGYEQAAVGPLISLLGVAWFIAVMFYVPLAQARQAVTGQWRSFYQFRLIWKVARYQWRSCVLLALLYALFAVPLSMLKTSPMFWMHNSPALGQLTNSQVVAQLKSYFFWCAIAVLPAYVILRLVAARVYASGIVSLVRTGKIAVGELAENERDALGRLELLGMRAEPERHVFVRLLAWTGTRLGRTIGAITLVLIWFSFVAQIYIAQFVNYHGGLGWINQTLVQVPWFQYLPTSVRNPLADVASALLVWLVALLAGSAARVFKPRRS